MSLFSVLAVSASGMSAQRARSEVLVENLANAETTRTPDGGPYRRKDVVFRSTTALPEFARLLRQEEGLLNAEGRAVEGVEVSDVIIDDRDPERRFLPGHPDADARGYVAFPRVNPAEDMVDLMAASRGFQANVSAMTAAKEMIARSIDLLK